MAILAVVVGIPFLLLLVLHRLLGPFTYYADPIRMRIVDEQTQRPIAGVVAVATWWQEGLNQILLYKCEAVSDANGILVIPAMPRRLRVPLTRLEWRDPWIVLYKPGYGARGLHNGDAYIRVLSPAGSASSTQPLPDGRVATTGGYSNSSKRFCYWNGKVVGLVPLRGPDAELATWDWMDGEINVRWYPPTDFPHIWKALVEGYDRLRPNHLPKNSGDPRRTIEYWSEK